MEVRRTRTDEELLEAQRIIQTAFLMPPEASEEDETRLETWAAFEGGHMLGATSVMMRALMLDGTEVPAGELHMVGTLPEARGTGVARSLIESVLCDFRSRGLLLATLIPFSEAFYRAFGFETAAANLEQEVAVEELRGLKATLQATRLTDERGLPEMRELYHSFASRYNLADVRGDEDEWAPRGFGEYGRRAFGFEDKTHYTYLMRDAQGALRAYLTFVFVEDESGPFTGTMQVTDIAFTDGEALRATLAFVHGMRAKIRRLKVTLPATCDLALLLPEGGQVTRTLDSHIMHRPLDVGRLLETRRWEVPSATFTLHVEDPLVEANSGLWHVAIEDGSARAERMDDQGTTPDLECSLQALSLLACASAGLDEALLRPDVVVNHDLDLLRRLFVKRPTFAS